MAKTKVFPHGDEGDGVECPPNPRWGVGALVNHIDPIDLRILIPYKKHSPPTPHILGPLFKACPQALKGYPVDDSEQLLLNSPFLNWKGWGETGLPIRSWPTLVHADWGLWVDRLSATYADQWKRLERIKRITRNHIKRIDRAVDESMDSFVMSNFKIRTARTVTPFDLLYQENVARLYGDNTYDSCMIRLAVDNPHRPGNINQLVVSRKRDRSPSAGPSQRVSSGKGKKPSTEPPSEKHEVDDDSDDSSEGSSSRNEFEKMEEKDDEEDNVPLIRHRKTIREKNRQFEHVPGDIPFNNPSDEPISAVPLNVALPSQVVLAFVPFQPANQDARSFKKPSTEMGSSADDVVLKQVQEPSPTPADRSGVPLRKSKSTRKKNIAHKTRFSARTMSLKDLCGITIDLTQESASKDDNSNDNSSNASACVEVNTETIDNEASSALTLPRSISSPQQIDRTCNIPDKKDSDDLIIDHYFEQPDDAALPNPLSVETQIPTKDANLTQDPKFTLATSSHPAVVPSISELSTPPAVFSSPLITQTVAEVANISTVQQTSAPIPVVDDINRKFLQLQSVISAFSCPWISTSASPSSVDAIVILNVFKSLLSHRLPNILANEDVVLKMNDLIDTLTENTSVLNAAQSALISTLKFQISLISASWKQQCAGKGANPTALFLAEPSSESEAFFNGASLPHNPLQLFRFAHENWRQFIEHRRVKVSWPGYFKLAGKKSFDYVPRSCNVDINVLVTAGWKPSVSHRMVFLVIPGLMYGRALIGIARKMRDEYNKAGTVVEQAISSVRTVYSFVGENKTIAEYSAALQGTVKLGLKQGLAKGLAIGSKSVVFAIWSFMSFYGSRLVMYHHARGGTVFAVGAAIAIGGLYDALFDDPFSAVDAHTRSHLFK
ncbi:hypothetical protein RJ640_002698, partial [Escallonia rubra]